MLQDIEFFKNNNAKLQSQEFSELCKTVKLEFYEAGKTIFRHGEKSDKFYFIIKGAVAISHPSAL